jgi:hypothetical protein
MRVALFTAAAALVFCGTFAASRAARTVGDDAVVYSVTCKDAADAASTIAGRDTTPVCVISQGAWRASMQGNRGGKPCMVAGTGPSADAQATATYTNNVNVTGWANLQVSWSTASPPSPSSLEYFAAGYAEGFATSALICDFSFNQQSVWFGGNATVRDMFVSFLTANYDWTAQQVAANNGSVYWTQVARTLAQVEGLAAGYAASSTSAGCPLSLADFLIMNAQGDGSDIGSVLLGSEAQVQWLNLTAAEVLQADMLRSHCTAIVRLTPDMVRAATTR